MPWLDVETAGGRGLAGAEPLPAVARHLGAAWPPVATLPEHKPATAGARA